MRNFLNKINWFGNKLVKTESLIEVVDVLSQLRDAKSEVSVQFDGADEGYSSQIFGINARHRIMVVDSAPLELEPEVLRRGMPLTVTSDVKGREFRFQSSFLEPFLPDPRMGYQIEMPTVLGMAHARGAFRVLLDELRYKVGITLLMPTSDEIKGTVENISRSGVGMKTKYQLGEGLKGESSQVECYIALKDSEEINCRMEIRNVREQNSGSHNTYVGGKMVDISRRDFNILEDFIASLQEQQLKAMIS